MNAPEHDDRQNAARWYWQRTRRLTLALLALWLAFNLGVVWYAEELNTLLIGGVPLGFLLLSTVSLILFTAIATVYALLTNRWERQVRHWGERDDG
ncbi:DUF4212 domain-containing protein [Tepidiphilus sp. J10]|uniref:DUF4212 domain-containing protein n=1 Tax=Tepidiphilus sp. J10 TaxID=2502185 RepID=UPI00115E561C|nr:sodium/substrate symporter small subunit [Tepidiphilus sp. J10]